MPRVLRAATLALTVLATAAPATAGAHPVQAGLQAAAAAQQLTPAQASQAWSLYRAGRLPTAPATLRAAADATVASARAGQLSSRALQALWGLQASAGQRQLLQGRQVIPGTHIEVRLYSGAWWPHQLGTWAWLGAAADDPKTKTQTLAAWFAQAQQLLSPGPGDTVQAVTLLPFSSGQTGWTSAMTQATAARTLLRLSQRLGRPDLSAQSHQMLADITPAGGLIADGRPLLYSDDQTQIVANAHAQTLLAVSQIADVDPTAGGLAAELNRTLQADLPGYLTPGWSLYSRGGPYAPLNYQQLMAGLTAQLCARGLGAVYCVASQRLYEQIGRPATMRVLAVGQLRHGTRSVVLSLSHPGRLRVAAKTASGFGAIAQLTARPGSNRVSVRWPAAGTQLSVSFVSVQGTTLKQAVPVTPTSAAARDR